MAEASSGGSKLPPLDIPIQIRPFFMIGRIYKETSVEIAKELASCISNRGFQNFLISRSAAIRDFVIKDSRHAEGETHIIMVFSFASKDAWNTFKTHFHNDLIKYLNPYLNYNKQRITSKKATKKNVPLQYEIIMVNKKETTEYGNKHFENQPNTQCATVIHQETNKLREGPIAAKNYYGRHNSPYPRAAYSQDPLTRIGSPDQERAVGLRKRDEKDVTVRERRSTMEGEEFSLDPPVDVDSTDLKLLFTIYIQDLEEETIASVSLNIDGQGTFPTERFPKSHLWSTCVFVPASACGFQYSFRIRRKQVSVSGFFIPTVNVKYDEVDTKKFLRDENDQRRSSNVLLCEEKYRQTGYAEICASIIASATDVKDAIMDLEHFQRQQHVHRMTHVLDVVEEQISYLPYKRERALSLLVFLSFLPQSSDVMLNHRFVLKMIPDILGAASQSSPGDLTHSCVERVSVMLFYLYCAMDRKKSFLGFVDVGFPLVSTSLLLEVCTRVLARKLMPIYDDETQLLHVLDTLQQESAIENDGITLVEKIIGNMPFRTLTMCTKHFLKTYGMGEKITTLASSALLTITKIETLKVSKAGKDRFKRLIDLWTIFSPLANFKGLDDSYVDFEKGIIHAIKSIESYSTCDGWDAVVDVCTDKHSGLFSHIDDQRTLLEVVVVAPNVLICDSLVAFLDSEKFCRLDLKTGQKLVDQWFDNTVNTYCKAYRDISSKNVCQVYRYFGRISRARNLRLYPDIRQSVSDKVCSILRKRGMKDNIRMTQEIENLNDSDVEQEFCKHMAKLISEGHDKGGYSINDMFRDICADWRATSLTIKSRVTLDICRSAMKLSKITVHSTREETVLRLLEYSDFWKVMFEATGHLQTDLKNDALYIHSEMTLREFVQSVMSTTVSCKLLDTIETTKFKSLLPASIYTASQQHVIVAKVKDCKQFSSDIQSKIVHITPLLEIIWQNTASTFKTHIESVQNQNHFYVDQIRNGDMPFGEIEVSYFTKWITQVHTDLNSVHKLLESRMYWNAIRHKLGNNCDEWIDKVSGNDTHESSERDAVEDIRWLFDTDCPPSEEYADVPQKIVRQFGKLLCGSVLDIYKDWWDMLKNHDTKIADVQKYFVKKTSMKKEIEIANCTYIAVRPKLERSLNNFEDYQQFGKVFQTIKDMMKAFELNSSTDVKFHKALESFEKLFVRQADELLLKDLDSAVQTMRDATRDISEEVVVIIDELNQSSSLIEFLREVINEDLRNLIDAVEEHSEQFVCESTVSDLIDIKHFLLPVLKENFDQDVKAFITTFTKSYTKCGVKNIPAKIRMCMDSIHSLKSLYHNVANKEENTKEVIKMINNNGIFRITINKHPCEICVECKQDKKVLEYNHSRLNDLRSRALLIMSTEEKRSSGRKELQRSNLTEHLINFSTIVDTMFDIVQTFDSLKSLGHFFWCKQCTQVVKPKEAKSVLKTLSAELDSWISLLTSCRKQFYFMNFISSEHLPLVQSFLERGEYANMVLNILKYINPKVTQSTLVHLRDSYHSGKEEASIEDKLYRTGRSVQGIFENMAPAERRFSQAEDDVVKIMDKVLESKLHICVLERESHLVLHTVLALYCNTTKILPESNQLLFCSKETTHDELTLLFNRCFAAPEHGLQRRLFCIVNAELLPYELQFKLTNILQSIPRGNKFLLAIVCRGREQCTFLDWFHDNVLGIRPLTEMQMKKCFEIEWPDVITVTSDIPGLGKTENVYDIASNHRKSVKTLHLSGVFNRSKIVKRLLDLQLRPHHLLHIDIGMINDPMALDLLLFQLIVTGFAASGTNAYALPTHCICIEVANSLNNTLIDSLSTAIHFGRKEIKWKDYANMKISTNINSPVQVVCQYLHHLEAHTVDTTDVYFDGGNRVKALARKECLQLLQKYFSTASDMSFTLVGIFINVLSDQMKRMSASIFFRQSSIKAMLGDQGTHSLKSKLVQIIVDVSKEFATRSIHTCRSSQAEVVSSDREGNTDSKAISRTAEMLSKRTGGMIQWEESNHLVVIFHHDMQTVSALFRNLAEVPKTVTSLFESQMKKQFDNLQKASPKELQEIILRFTSSKKGRPQNDLLKSYALTPDNLLKMVLVVLRLQSSVPVVIMGETGCGKTSLVRYLSSISDTKLDILSIHAGTTEDEIVAKIDSIQAQACKKLSDRRWVFLDEVNTCDHLGIITDLLCHHRYLGQTLAPNIAVIAACNPYRLRHANAIYTEGLQGKIKDDELSRLVYRVHPLPESLIDFVWDYGRLSDTDEMRYIATMVGDVLQCAKLSKVLVEALSMSQDFVRNLERADYSVSLRQVDRSIRLLKWFIEMLNKKYDIYRTDDQLRRNAIVLAMAMSYHSRISEASRRKHYRTKLASVFCMHHDYLTEKDVMEIIRTEQDDILNRMEIPEGIARNTALRENVFVIFVSILNKIPVFVVGKPGCSKSLSMQLIRSNLRGKDSKDVMFKTLPQLFCVSFQGSESSTSDGIVKVFEKAKRYQDRNTSDNVLSVVILDEIGLAEISRFNPLKVLHGLLEPNGNRNPDVAVVGISNWALDAAKMNRAIHLSRPEMNVEELLETAISINQSLTLTPTGYNTRGEWNHLEHGIRRTLQALALAFDEYNLGQRFKNFHGLRDYYSLTKFISRCTAKSEYEMSDLQKTDTVLRGLLRNFGGLPSEMTNLKNTFQKHLDTQSDVTVPVVDLIRENLEDMTCRHLMLITQGDAVVNKLEQLLKGCGKDHTVIFGSQFEDDLTDDYNYRILSRIILCMEQGMVLILKDLESIYGSLYDMLNQNYTVVGKKKNCRVALGPYSNPMCHVHDDFKCIVLVEETNLDFSDPPFLNRFEKQQFRFGDMLSSEDRKIIFELQKILQVFVEVPGRQFTVSKAMPLYGGDVLSSLVLSVKETTEACGYDDVIKRCLLRILPLFYPEAIVRSTRSTLSCEEPTTVSVLNDAYFELPIHKGLDFFLAHRTNRHVSNQDTAESDIMQMHQDEDFCIIFTHSNIHVNLHNLITNYSLYVQKVGAFKSEKDLTTAIETFFESDRQFLFFQFDARCDMQHFLLTKIAIENKRMESMKNSSRQICRKDVYLVIHMGINDSSDSVISQIHFVSGWDIVTLDTLERPQRSILDLKDKTLMEIISDMRPLHSIIKEQLLWAFTRLQYSYVDRHVENLEQTITIWQGSTSLLDMIDDFVISQIESLIKNAGHWEFDIACDEHALISAGTYIGAIEAYILDIIRKPIAIYVFKLEQEGCLESFFLEDNKTIERRKTWECLVGDKRFCNFEDIPMPTGPECYNCTTPSILRKMPFSNCIILQMEELRDEYVDTLRKVKIQSDQFDSDEDCPIEIVHALLGGYKDIVTSSTSVAELADVGYDGMTQDYFHDFCNSMTFTNSPDERGSTEAMQWAIESIISWGANTFIDSVMMLHAIYWTYMDRIDSIVSILELACTINSNGLKVRDIVSSLECTSETEIDELNTCCLEEQHEEEEVGAMNVPEETINERSAIITSEQSMEEDRFNKSFTPVGSFDEEQHELVVHNDQEELDAFLKASETEDDSEIGNKPSASTTPGQQHELADVHNDKENFDDLFKTSETADDPETDNAPSASTTPGQQHELADIHNDKEEVDDLFKTSETEDDSETGSMSTTCTPGEQHELADVHNDKEEVDALVKTSETEVDPENGTKQSTSTTPEERNEIVEIHNHQETVDALFKTSETEDDYETGNKSSISTTPEHPSIKAERVDKLVMYVGKLLLPTTTNLHFMEFTIWHDSLKRVLPLIGQVSGDLEISLKLRFCSDLASILIAPYHLDANHLTSIGDRLQQSGIHLNDKDIFFDILSLVKDFASHNIPTVKLNKLISLYINRCVQTQSENSDLFVCFLDWIEQEDQYYPTSSVLLPDFHFMGPVLQIAIYMQLLEDEDPFLSIIDGSDDWKSNVFCKSLNHCLSNLSPEGKVLQGISTLLVHILENNISEQDDAEEAQSPDTLRESLETALNVMKFAGRDNVPLVRITCIAYIRHVLIKSADKCLQQDFIVDENTSMLQCLNAIFQSTIESDDHEQQGPLTFFLKRTKAMTGLRRMQALCDQLSPAVPIFNTIEWTKDHTTISLDFNPMELHCSDQSMREVDEACAIWIEKPDQLKSLCNQTNKNVEKLLSIERILMNTFMKKTFVPITESDKKLVSAILGYLSLKHINANHTIVLDYLGGKKDFRHQLFHLNTEMKEPDPQIVSVLLHMICITTLRGQPGHVFYDSMLTPEVLDYDPADVVWKMIAQNEAQTQMSYCECACCVIYVSSTNVCPSCGRKQQSTEHGWLEVAPMQTLTDDNADVLVTYVLFRFLVNASSFCSLALDMGNINNMTAITEVTGDERSMPDVLHENVMKDWKILCLQLNMTNSELCCLLNIFLCTKMGVFLNLRIPRNVNSQRDVIFKFLGCIRDVLQNRHVILQKYLADFASRRGIQGKIECTLGNTSMDHVLTLYEPSDTATVDNLIAELSLLGQSEHTFLRVVLRNRQLLALPTYITDILKWHLAVVNLRSYKVRKFECTERTITAFLCSTDDDDASEKLRKTFGNFKTAWNRLRETRQLLLHIDPSLPEMELMTTDACATQCLIMDTNSVIYHVLRALVRIQNSILIEAMNISNSKDLVDFNVLSCGSDSAMVRCVSILDVKQKDVILFEWTDDYLRFSQCKPNSGPRSGILYDFHKIEMELAHEIVFRKAVITHIGSLPLIVFADELFRNSVILLRRVSDRITPQYPLTVEITRGVEHKRGRNPSHTIQLLSQIGIILSLLNKTGGDPQASLIDYLEKWKGYVAYTAIKMLLPEPENSFKLGHVVAMYEYLEYRSGEEISDTLDERFRTPLPCESHRHLKAATLSHASLQVVDKGLKVFVHRNVSTKENAVDLQLPLIKCLMDPIYWRRDIDVRNGAIDESSVEAMSLRNVLSSTCLLEHLYEAMAVIKQAMEQYMASETRISSVAAVYKDNVATRHPAGKRRKLAKKITGKT